MVVPFLRPLLAGEEGIMDRGPELARKVALRSFVTSPPTPTGLLGLGSQDPVPSLLGLPSTLRASSQALDKHLLRKRLSR